MPKAEPGSTKWLGNKMKAKGLQRLRWYCQACQRQMRDANGFKQHTLSEAHIRQMQIIGQDANRHISNYSNEFKQDFLQLLRTSHGEKMVNINHFYQEYIADKQHIHMNATKWPSLTEFAKFLGREGICRIEERDRGLEIAWIDNSPEALRRQVALKKKERQDRGDEEREQRLIEAQVSRANADAMLKEQRHHGCDISAAPRELRRQEGGKLSLNLGQKRDLHLAQIEEPTPQQLANDLTLDDEPGVGDKSRDMTSDDAIQEASIKKGLSPKMGAILKPNNVFATSKRKDTNLLAKNLSAKPLQRPMSEAERIMRTELERKRQQRNLILTEKSVKRVKV